MKVNLDCVFKRAESCFKHVLKLVSEVSYVYSTVIFWLDLSINMTLECRCNLTGTVNSSNVCNEITGQCSCKQLLTGRTCNQCQVSLLFHVQIFFLFIYKNKQTDVHKNSCKKRFAFFIYCGANFEFWLRQGEGGHFFLRRDSFEGRCKFKYFLNRSSLITEKITHFSHRMDTLVCHLKTLAVLHVTVTWLAQ